MNVGLWVSFLDDILRITQEDYVPTPGEFVSLPTGFPCKLSLVFAEDDVLRARVQTIGPQEHHIHLEIRSYMLLLPYFKSKKKI